MKHMNKNPLESFIKEDHFEMSLYLTFLFSACQNESKEITREQPIALDKCC